MLSTDELSQLTSLELLYLDGIKKCDFAFISKLKSLKSLEMNNCGNIPNIMFLNDLPNLTRFVFINTSVLDGNLTPCLRLEHAATLDKRHYNIKNNQLPNQKKA